jgi:ubiquinone/menaquinone biosynthesis C-methylase UbiE
MISPTNDESNTYVIDAENGAEMARLIDQAEMMTRAMGGLLVEQAQISELSDVLDIGCGPGAWILQMAEAFPHMEITGIDISQRMITYARTHAQVRKLSNAHFCEMDATSRLTFANASFDLINARTIFGFMSPQTWPLLLKECRRLLRPGGIIRLTEVEGNFTNLPALETYFSWINLSLMRSGNSFAPTGRHIGTVNMLPRLLREAGFTNTQLRPHVLDSSAGTPFQAIAYEDFQALFKLIQPHLLKMQVASQEELDRVYEQATIELRSDELCSFSFIVTVWAQNP